MLRCGWAALLDNGKKLVFSVLSLEEVMDGINEETKVMTYDELKEKYLWSKEFTLCWLKDEALIASSRVCDVC